MFQKVFFVLYSSFRIPLFINQLWIYPKKTYQDSKNKITKNL